jgi:hypothetical protein
MSWDIVLFNSSEKIVSVGTLDSDKLEPTNFCTVFERNFENIEKNDNHRRVNGKEYSFEYFYSEENTSNMIVFLYGENALFEIVVIAKKYNWQIFDTGLGEMIDLDNPSKN